MSRMHEQAGSGMDGWREGGVYLEGLELVLCRPEHRMAALCKLPQGVQLRLRLLRLAGGAVINHAGDRGRPHVSSLPAAMAKVRLVCCGLHVGSGVAMKRHREIDDEVLSPSHRRVGMVSAH